MLYITTKPTICSDGHKIELTKSSGSRSGRVILFLNSTRADLPLGNYSIADSSFVMFGSIGHKIRPHIVRARPTPIRLAMRSQLPRENRVMPICCRTDYGQCLR